MVAGRAQSANVEPIDGAEMSKGAETLPDALLAAGAEEASRRSYCTGGSVGWQCHVATS
jgi:hypothetical protein